MVSEIHRIATYPSRGRWMAAGFTILALLSLVRGTTSTAQSTASSASRTGNYQLPESERNPVIVIPGVLGSRLVEPESGKVVWGRYNRIHLFRTRASDLSTLALPMAIGRGLHELRDNVRSDGTLAYLQIKILGVPVELKAYQGILATLAIGGYRDPASPMAAESAFGEDHFSCFQFDYDWRRDVSENAVLLDQFINEKRQFLQAEYRRRYGQERPDIQFDIVAHSLGGLLTRYYLRYGHQPIVAGRPPALTWAGARNVRKAILVGTPNAGSTFAVEDLVKGHQLSRFFPYYPAAVLGTMPSVYQMMPHLQESRIVDAASGELTDLYDERTWQQREWGLARRDGDDELKELLPEVDDREARYRVAMEHLRKCLTQARTFHQSLDFPATPPAGTSLHLFVGTADKTPSILQTSVGSDSLRVAQTEAGDNTTTVCSAIGPHWQGRPVIQWASIQKVDAEHRKLTSDPVFTEKMLDLLLDSRRVALRNGH